MTEFEVGGHTYRANKMPVFAQFHVARRLAPAIGAIGPRIMAAAQAEIPMDTAFAELQPLAEVIAKMSDEDCEYVLRACLAVCQRKQAGDTWASVWHSGAARFVFEDIALPEMMQIAFQVIQENLAAFFSGQGSTSPEPLAGASPERSNGSASLTARTG